MKKVLIVDDSLFMRGILKNILFKKYKVTEAASRAEALKHFRRENPDMVLLDIVMPGGEEEGVQALRDIVGSYPEALVIMVTAVGQDSVIEECTKIGAKDYIVKPFDEKLVLRTVEKYLSQPAAASL